MEMEDIKNTWKKLDERLQKSNLFQEKLIKNTIHTQSKKSVGKLIASDFVSVIILLLLVPFIVFFYIKRSGILLAWDIFVIFSILLCLGSTIWLTYRIWWLMKIDFSKSIKENVYIINKYNIYVKREKMILNFFMPVYLILIVFIGFQTKAGINWWVLFICLTGLAILYGYWSYKRIYFKNIDSIKKSLDELEELE